MTLTESPAVSAAAARAGEAPRMNILFIMADQYRFDCMGSLSHPVVQTPNLDRLAVEGVNFTSAYAPTLACGPARSSIFTGYYQDTHGMRGNPGRSGAGIKPGVFPVLPGILEEAGYDTALIGKLHIHPLNREFGFRHVLLNDYLKKEIYESDYIKYLQETVFAEDREEPVRRFTEDEDSLYTDEMRFMLGSNFVDEEHHHTAWTARETIKYLKEGRDKNRPFFLNCSFFGPHQPYLCPGRWENMYDPADIPLPADFHTPADDKPIYAAAHAKFRQQREKAGWDENTYRRILSAYYGNISMIDHYTGKIMDALKEEGLWDNTVIIFTADHGDFAGQLKLFYKGPPYEGCIRVPLIIRRPGAGKMGGKVGLNVSNMDIYSTCLKTAGVEPREDAESRDLSVLLEGGEDKWDNRVFFKTGESSALKRDDFKLMRAAVNEKRVYEFYVLPGILTEGANEIDNPRYGKRISGMKKELDEWHRAQSLKSSRQ